MSGANLNRSGALSIDDLESIRDVLRQRAGSSDPTISQPAKEASDAIRDLASGESPEYGAAMEQYGRHSAYIEGFQHGHAGKSLGDIEDSGMKIGLPTGDAYLQGHASGLLSGLAHKAAGSEAGAQSVLQALAQQNGLRDDLARAYGPDVADRLANVGGQLSRASSALDAVAPRGPVMGAHAESPVPSFGRAALSAGLDSHVGVAHNIVHAIMDMLGPRKISDAAGAKLAQMLGDPSQNEAALDILRRQGATDAQISRITGYVTGLGSQMTASGLQSLFGR